MGFGKRNTRRHQELKHNLLNFNINVQLETEHNKKSRKQCTYIYKN